MHILVTGAAGFVGMHVAEALLKAGHQVTGIDNLNAYYDVALKEARLARLREHHGFSFHKLDLADEDGMAALFAGHDFQRVVHLGAQAGVRYSIENPLAYIHSNLVGMATVLEGCRHHGVEHLVYASSSSVYGLNSAMPFRVGQTVDHPVSLYAATKKADELLAHTYSHLYGLPTTGLRFFTVYGPWGRPDMAYWTFTQKILAGKPIQLFNHGEMQRDFTYIDDVVEGVVRLLDHIAAPDPEWSSADPNPATSSAPWRVYNIGNNQPARLRDFVAAIEAATGCEAATELLPMQPGDVEATWADVDALQQAVGYTPSTPLKVGIQHFVDWYSEWSGAGDAR